MAKIDAVVWSAFLEQHGAEIGFCYYDVHVGEPVSLPPGSPEFLYEVAEGITVKRIDAITHYGEWLLICEVKPLGNAAALGQCLLYAALFREKYPDAPKVAPCIICNELDRDVAALAPSYGITCFETRVIDQEFGNPQVVSQDLTIFP